MRRTRCAAITAWILAAGALVAPAAAQDGFTFPPEWAPHEAVWMGWTDWSARDEAVQAVQAEMLKALTPHVTVKMIADSEEAVDAARAALGGFGAPVDQVRFVVTPTQEIWLRDSGPLFLTDGASKQIADFRWAFYGFPFPIADEYGFARGALDGELAAAEGWERRRSDLVAEGGALEVNSRTLIAYRDAAQHRNPGVSLARIEAEYLRLYGKENMVWLSRAPISDRVFVGPKVANVFGWGANGHTDEYVRFVDENTILVAQMDEAERNKNAFTRLEYEILEENWAELEAARNADGEPFNLIATPVPDVMALADRHKLTETDFQDPETGWDGRAYYRDFKVGDKVVEVPAASYMNFLITNGVVLVSNYWEEGRPKRLRETDEAMRAILAERFPDRQIVQIAALPVNWNGGGMHCITQQEPALAGR